MTASKLKGGGLDWGPIAVKGATGGVIGLLVGLVAWLAGRRKRR